jgi:hypothetical protein
MKSGDIYEQVFVKPVLSLPKGRLRDFFTGIPNIYSASLDSEAPLDYVRASSSHHIEGLEGVPYPFGIYLCVLRGMRLVYRASA